MIRDLADLLAIVQANQSLQPNPSCSPICRHIMATHVWVLAETPGLAPAPPRFC